MIFPTAQGYTFERINKDDVMLLVVDHQIGLFQLVHDFGPDEFRNNTLAHAAIGKVFNLPTILTTSAETGPNGPLPKEIIAMHPNAPWIKHNGEVDAWTMPNSGKPSRRRARSRLSWRGS
ncbi:hypothetical protein BU17DRAFT_101780 [Hysterangium stoloniferum]|nr:hypothetical protein BU17DRAFT_101780 [Hysterangium stoloniferum]